MEIHQVRYFLEVCIEHNFTRAAKKCGVAQPSLTRAIKLLEMEFGGPLFGRGHGKVELTELGRVVLPYLQNVWDQTAAVKRITSGLGSRGNVKLRLAVMCTIAPKLLIEMIANFRTRHSDFRLEITDGTAPAIEDRLLNAEVDIAIFSRPKRPPNLRLNYFSLFREQMLIAVPQHHRFARQSSILKSELEDEVYVMRSFCEFGEKSGHEIEHDVAEKLIHRSDRDDWVIAMIASGFGYGFVPRHSLEGSGLAAVPLMPDIWREIYLTTVIDRPQTPAVGALLHEAMTTSWPK